MDYRVRRTFFPSGWRFFYLVTTSWIFDISLCENSIIFFFLNGREYRVGQRSSFKTTTLAFGHHTYLLALQLTKRYQVVLMIKRPVHDKANY